MKCPRKVVPMNDVGKQIIVLQTVVDADLLVVHGERPSFNATFLKVAQTMKALAYSFSFKKKSLTYSSAGCARNSLAKTSRIRSPTQRPLVKVVKVK